MLFQLLILSSIAAVNGHPYNYKGHGKRPQESSVPNDSPTSTVYDAPAVEPTSATVNPTVPTPQSAVKDAAVASSTSYASSGTSYAGAATSVATSVATSAAEPTGYVATNGAGCPAGQQAITFQNDSGEQIALDALGWTVGNCGTIAAGSTCTTCQPMGVDAANIAVGTKFPGDIGVERRVTWVEGNTKDNVPWINISNIPGYTFPVKCTGTDGTTVGYDQPLCKSADCTSECNNGGGTWYPNMKSCVNWKGGDPDLDGLARGGDGYSPLPFFEQIGISQAYWYPIQDTNQPTTGSSVKLIQTGPAWMTANCVVGKRA